MIIIEGPDGSGKSTLIKTLGLPSKRVKALRGGVGGTKFDGTGDGLAGWGGDDPAVLCYYRLIDRHAHEDVAYDRFHLSEAAYGPILRGVQELDAGALALLKHYLVGYGVRVVLCLPPFETTLANVRQAGRERPAYQTDDFLRRSYDAFVQLTPWATVVYDYVNDPPFGADLASTGASGRGCVPSTSDS
jgi:hypothetical protein